MRKRRREKEGKKEEIHWSFYTGIVFTNNPYHR